MSFCVMLILLASLLVALWEKLYISINQVIVDEVFGEKANISGMVHRSAHTDPNWFQNASRGSHMQ